MKKLYKKDRLFTLGRWLLLALCLGLALAAAGCRKNPADEPLTVTEAFPANGAVEVPEDAAIEMTFSVPPEKLDNYFVIQPELKGRFHYMGNTVAFIPFRGWDQESETWSDGLRYDTQYTITIQAGLGAEGGKGKLQEDFSFSFTVCKILSIESYCRLRSMLKSLRWFSFSEIVTFLKPQLQPGLEQRKNMSSKTRIVTYRFIQNTCRNKTQNML